MLMFFGYTHCPDICGTGLAEMAAVMDALGSDAERVQPLFITVDPTRDRPRDLKAFTAQFHPRLVGLTGTEAEIKTVAKLYRIHRRKVLIPGEPEADYLAMHTALIYLIGLLYYHRLGRQNHGKIWMKATHLRNGGTASQF